MKGNLTQIMHFHVSYMTLEHRTYHMTLLWKSLIKIGVEPNEENRKRFRNMMFHADKKIGENLGGVILHHETIYQKDDNGKRKCSFSPKTFQIF